MNRFLEKVVLSDTDINVDRILEEKEKLGDIKNDIYNMTLKLKNIEHQITEEIDSYLIIEEIDYAKERFNEIIDTHKPIGLTVKQDAEIEGILEEARIHFRKKGLL